MASKSSRSTILSAAGRGCEDEEEDEESEEEEDEEEEEEEEEGAEGSMLTTPLLFF
jgi:hypothetical protein